MVFDVRKILKANASEQCASMCDGEGWRYPLDKMTPAQCCGANRNTGAVLTLSIAIVEATS
jgi:hypothetical protein